MREAAPSRPRNATAEDQAIIVGLRDGDGSRGLERAWHAYAHLVRAMLSGLGCTSGDLDEATIDVFVRMLSRRERAHDGNVAGWLRSIARYVAPGYRRQSARRIRYTKQAAEEWTCAPPPSADGVIADEELRTAYADIRETLSPGEVVLWDSLDAEICDAELVLAFEAASGQRRTVGHLRRLRLAVRKRVADRLQDKGFTP